MTTYKSIHQTIHKTASTAPHGAAIHADDDAAIHADPEPVIPPAGGGELPPTRLTVGHTAGKDKPSIIIGVPARDGQSTWVRLTLEQARDLARQLAGLVETLVDTLDSSRAPTP